ncbi:MAG: putative diguanylate phosphodiesterase [Ilumatobacteraceae bacterium]|nr:putative diguanylate phosphodiesterase [Ilumatobacteraceae bacterium]
MSMDADQEQQERERDRALVARVLGGNLTSAYQPIVDLDRGAVLGYEALVRYTPAAVQTPNALFSATDLFDSARRIGRVEEIEAAALTAALRARDELPRDCLLFLNVGLESLVDERVERVLRDQGDLSGVVLEIDEPDHHLLDGARDTIDAFRDRGSVIAVVDPFLDPTRLEAMMQAEPGFFKLDRQLISGVSVSNTKLALVDSVRHLAERLGVGVIAQGIEDLADLRSLERVGIGFGQGYLLARPSTERRFSTAVSGLVAAGGSGHGSGSNEQPGQSGTELARLIEAVCELTEHELDQPMTTSNGIEFEVLVTDIREPMALMRRVGRRIQSLSLTLVDEHAGLQQAARIAMRRPESTRFEPLVCVDELGACLGVVRVERLLSALAGADRSVRPSSADAEGHRNRWSFDFSCRPSRQHRGR